MQARSVPQVRLGVGDEVIVGLPTLLAGAAVVLDLALVGRVTDAELDPATQPDGLQS